MENLDKLVLELCKYSNEQPWLEFKHNNYDPEMIGQDISALANGAALSDKEYAYMIWGVNNETHEICGTDENLQTIKKGNEELENWLRHRLSSNVDFEFQTTKIQGNLVGVLLIQKVISLPATFDKTEYIRSGSYTKKLKDFPALQARLWDKLRNAQYETICAKKDLSLSDALKYLDYGCYFDLLNLTQPSDNEGVAHYLIEDGILSKSDNGLYNITNMGALLFAKRMSDFEKISRKAIRIAKYNGINRLSLQKEYPHTKDQSKGYAVDFENIIKYLEALLPANEVIVDGIRKNQTAFPMLAIREIVANSLIHQDLAISGTGPVVEIFENRIEITNPGLPLVDIMRIVDNPPKSRNEKLASLMRRLGICEELGTGWDKIVLNCETMQLQAPKISLYEENTRVILYSNIPFPNLSQEDKLWTCYLHACILQIQGEQMTNSSLRQRFGVPESSSGSISRLIKEAMKAKFVKPLDPTTAPRYMKYIPIWA